MSGKKKREQHTYWIPKDVKEMVHRLYEENKENLKLVNVQNESQLFKYLVMAGEPEVKKILQKISS